MSTRLSTEELEKLKRCYLGLPPDADAKVLVAEIEASWAENGDLARESIRLAVINRDLNERNEAARRALRDLTAAFDEPAEETPLPTMMKQRTDALAAARAVLSENPKEAT